MNPDVSRARARVGALTRAVRAGERTPEELANAKRDLQAANVAAYIEKTLATAPPLTEQQLTRLRELLRSASGAA